MHRAVPGHTQSLHAMGIVWKGDRHKTLSPSHLFYNLLFPKINFKYSVAISDIPAYSLKIGTVVTRATVMDPTNVSALKLKFSAWESLSVKHGISEESKAQGLNGTLNLSS